MAIDIIPKKQETGFQFSLFNVFIILCVVIFALEGAGYFALDYFSKKTNKELQGINAQISQKETPETKNLEKEMKNYQEKIENISPLLDTHIYTLKIFPLIEALTHPQASFTKISFSAKDYKASLSGKTESFQTLGQQLRILEEKKEKENLFTNINLSKFSIEKEGSVGFSLDLSFNPSVFK